MLLLRWGLHRQSQRCLHQNTHPQVQPWLLFPSPASRTTNICQAFRQGLCFQTSETVFYSFSLSFHVSPVLTSTAHIPTWMSQMPLLYYVSVNRDPLASKPKMLTSLCLLQMSTLTWKLVLSALFPKCFRNLAPPLTAQVFLSHTGHCPLFSLVSLPPFSLFSPRSPPLPKLSFKNLGNAHVPSLLLKTLKSQRLQDKGTCQVCHLKFLKGCHDLPYILPGALSPLPQHVHLPYTYIPGALTGPTLMLLLSSDSSFCPKHPPHLS